MALENLPQDLLAPQDDGAATYLLGQPLPLPPLDQRRATLVKRITLVLSDSRINTSSIPFFHPTSTPLACWRI